MKKNFIPMIILALVLIFSGVKPVYGQLGNLGNVLAAGLDDAEKLAGAYITPFANGFGATLNSGWYNSAKPHSLLGFDLTLTVSAAFIPATAKSFNVSELGLGGDIMNNVTSSPTVAGKRSDDVSRLRYMQGTDELVQFDLPKGTGLGFVPAPMVSIGLGLVKDTDIKFRYIPNLNISDYGNLGLWGIGLKHSLKQWIPVLKRIPVFNLSLQGGYTQFNLNAPLDFKPSDIDAVDQTSESITFDNQKFDMKVKSYTVNLLVSADIPVITFYGGLGISATNTNLKFMGYYPIPTLDGTIKVVTDQSIIKKDPLNISIKHKSGSSVLPRLNAGFKLKMAVVTLHADYTYSDYSIVTAGLGVSFR
jgi:hypothetical protein